MVLKFLAADNAPRLTLVGFRSFWAWYVTGFDPSKHCQACLLGRRSARVNKSDVRAGVEIVLDEFVHFDYLYVCGVSSTCRWEHNFHLVVRPRTGAYASAHCYTGQQMGICDAERIQIPELPDGFNGKSRKFTTCRNYQFGVARYQLGLGCTPSIANADGTYGRHRFPASPASKDSSNRKLVLPEGIRLMKDVTPAGSAR
jgi:hypothetical protein